MSRHLAPPVIPDGGRILSLTCAAGDHDKCSGRARPPKPSADGVRFVRCQCTTCKHPAL